jgi:hypothetical protein
MKLIDKILEADHTVQKAVARGCKIKHSFRSLDDKLLDFKVFNGGRPAAHATFSVIKPRKEIQAERVNVYPGHERRGVGNAIYVCAVKLTGYKPIPAANQTEEGRAFWNQPNRPW